MNLDYIKFVSEFRKALVMRMDIPEDKISFKRKNEEVSEETCREDKLIVEYARTEGAAAYFSVRPERLYEEYRSGCAIEELAESVWKEFSRTGYDVVLKTALELKDYDKTKERLFVRLLNLDRNSEELENAVYEVLGDIAIVLYVKVSEGPNYVTSAKIQCQNLKQWNVSREEAFTEALENTARMSPPRVYDWCRMLMDPEYEGEDFMEDEGARIIANEIRGNCISTSTKTNGAVTIFCPGVAPRLAEIVQDDLYLVFTSVHEVMVHSRESVDAAALKTVLHDTIECSTPEEDFLTYKIYEYRRTDRTFCVVEEEPLPA